MDKDFWNDMWAGHPHDPDHGHRHDHGHGHDNPHEHLGGPDPLLVEVAGDLRPGRSLDLACGLGMVPKWLAEHGWDALGVDWSDVAVQRARAQADRSGATFQVSDLLSYEPEGSFDLVSLFYAHLEAADRATLLARAASWLNPGGILLIVAHDRSEKAFHDRIGAERLTDPAEVAAELAGLQILRCETILHQAHGHEAMGTTVVVARR